MTRTRVVVLVVLLLAFALRLPGLQEIDLGMDGGWSLALASLSRAELLDIAARDVHPPLYYLLLHYWVVAVGPRPLAVKYLSLAFGLVMAAVILVTGKRMGGSRCGVLSMLLLALSPSHLSSGAMVRDFPAALCLLSLGTYAFLRRKEGWRWAATFALAGLASLLTSYISALYIGLLFAWGAMETVRSHRGSVKDCLRDLGVHVLPFCVMLVGATVWLFAPLAKLLARSSAPQVGGGISPMALDPWSFVADIAGLVFLGEFSPLRNGMVSGLGCLLLLAGLWRWRQTTSKAAALVWAQLVVGMLGVYALVSFWAAEGLASRYALLLLPSAVPVMGWSLHRLGESTRKGLGLVLAAYCVALLLGDAGYWNRPKLPQNFWDPSGMVGYLDEQARPEDAIVFLTLEQAGYYESLTSASPRCRWYYFIVGADYLQHDVAGRTEVLLPQVSSGHARVWLVSYLGGLPGSEPVADWMLDRWFPFDGRWLNDSLIRGFSIPQQPLDHYSSQAVFSNTIRLSQAFATPRAESGGAVNVLLDWMAVSPPDADYSVFLHLVGSDGKRWAQHDGIPNGGRSPTSTWRSGQRFEDRHGLLLPQGMPPGDYTIIAGLYSSTTRLRLPDGSESTPVARIRLD